MRGKLLPQEQYRQYQRITPAGAGKTALQLLRYVRKGDHPRRCGENEAVFRTYNINPGSPPQVRGKLQLAENPGGGAGITPAGAGKTTTPTLLFNVQWDHPRRCGENDNALFFLRLFPGSPPQVRGKRRIPDIRAAFHRITPAGAGKTGDSDFFCRYSWDHPRRCGENFMAWGSGKRNAGSPPQVRGKLNLARYNVGIYGITPADAGKTRLGTVLSSTLRDHPRGCGENHRLKPHKAHRSGSPPRMRGKLYTHNTVCVLHRITPADAGKTLGDRVNAVVAVDHPRGCGENRGSRPHAAAHRRITPADAGKTTRGAKEYMVAQDHPRGCGENQLHTRLRQLRKGSPPRMRGKHPRLRRLSP